MKIHARRLLAIALLQLLLGGCTLVQLRNDTDQFYSATVLAGRVWATSDWHGPVIVSATTSVNGRTEIAHQVLLHEPGGFELIVPNGVYELIAYGDRDANGLPDPHDPAGVLSKEVKVEGAGLISLLDFPLSMSMTETARRALPAVLPSRPTHSTQIGAIANLDAPAFSRESGSRGYWTPLEAFRSTGGNIYFLEPYDATRIPVLFVHGASGSAQDWRSFFEHLDDGRYQAWFFQYPSGAALDSMAHLLYWKLLNAQLRYGFERLHIVAHSMGGLVVRRLLLDHADQLPQVDQFITISTPWGGEPFAKLGVEHSPAVVPSWRDMQPDGSFLKRLFDRRLPDDIDHALLFSHRGGYNLIRPTTDGAVTLASQLRPEAQENARFVKGFDEDHVSVLAAPAALEQVSRILGSRDPDAAPSNDGRLYVELMYSGGLAAAGGVPVLVLTPTRVGDSCRHRCQVMLPVPWADGKRSIGPVEPGEYEISLVAPGFSSAPRVLAARVERGSALRLKFDLTPQGYLSGYVVSERDAITHPAGSYRPPEHTLAIRSIVLEGPSGTRTLAPRAYDDSAPAGCATSEDDAVGACFNFVDLPAGDYALTIVADDYEPHVSHHRVEPGVLMTAKPIALRRR